MAKRGRPIKSKIRDRMQQVIDALGVSYGYEIYKVYVDAFEPIDLRSMYYHLAKGVTLNEFQEIGVKQVKGKYTWGDLSIRKYYFLGPAADYAANDSLHIIIKTLGLEYKNPKKFVDWNAISTGWLSKLKQKYVKGKERDLGTLLKECEDVSTWLGKYTTTTGFSGLKNKIQRNLKK